MLHFILFAIYYFNLLQFSPVSSPISGAVTRKGLTTPLTRWVASGCYLCAGAVYVWLLGSPTGSIPWFHNWGKYLPSLCYIIPPSPGKYRRCSSYHQSYGDMIGKSLPTDQNSRHQWCPHQWLRTRLGSWITHYQLWEIWFEWEHSYVLIKFIN